MWGFNLPSFVGTLVFIFILTLIFVLYSMLGVPLLILQTYCERSVTCLRNHSWNQ
ncbi:hypothetical protein JB92DRAFT_2873337 [Gautieria morchelliformis]|nr:hypothetical protein JB92DRAFT_2873337 [Gautieria morchelliformis]